MYTKDKKQRLTLRLNEAQFEFVQMNAEILDVSPSDFLRMVINSAMSSYKVTLQEGGSKRRENEQDLFNDQL